MHDSTDLKKITSTMQTIQREKGKSSDFLFLIFLFSHQVLEYEKKNKKKNEEILGILKDDVIHIIRPKSRLVEILFTFSKFFLKYSPS